MLKFTSQKFLIWTFVPGSCPPKSLLGTPITTNPSDLNSSHSDCNPSYWLVNPHSEAVLTRSITLPVKSDRGIIPPSIESKLKSYADLAFAIDEIPKFIVVIIRRNQFKCLIFINYLH